MNFTLSEPDFGSSCGNRDELGLLLLLALLLASPLLLWLRRSARDSRDVLHAEPVLSISRAGRLLDVAAWALPSAVILLPLLAGLKLLYAFLFLDPVALMGIPAAPETVGTTELDLLPRDGVITVLVYGACLVLRHQHRRSEPDVLSLHVRA